MLRYKTKTRPGLVALYDIRPGNGAGPFLQPRSPHGATSRWMSAVYKLKRRGPRSHSKSSKPTRIDPPLMTFWFWT